MSTTRTDFREVYHVANKRNLQFPDEHALHALRSYVFHDKLPGGTGCRDPQASFGMSSACHTPHRMFCADSIALGPPNALRPVLVGTVACQACCAHHVTHLLLPSSNILSCVCVRLFLCGLLLWMPSLRVSAPVFLFQTFFNSTQRFLFCPKSNLPSNSPARLAIVFYCSYSFMKSLFCCLCLEVRSAGGGRGEVPVLVWERSLPGWGRGREILLYFWVMMSASCGVRGRI